MKKQKSLFAQSLQNLLNLIAEEKEWTIQYLAHLLIESNIKKRELNNWFTDRTFPSKQALRNIEGFPNIFYKNEHMQNSSLPGVDIGTIESGDLVKLSEVVKKSRNRAIEYAPRIRKAHEHFLGIINLDIDKGKEKGIFASTLDIGCKNLKEYMLEDEVKYTYTPVSYERPGLSYEILELMLGRNFHRIVDINDKVEELFFPKPKDSEAIFDIFKNMQNFYDWAFDHPEAIVKIGQKIKSAIDEADQVYAKVMDDFFEKNRDELIALANPE